MFDLRPGGDDVELGIVLDVVTPLAHVADVIHALLMGRCWLGPLATVFPLVQGLADRDVARFGDVQAGRAVAALATYSLEVHHSRRRIVFVLETGLVSKASRVTLDAFAIVLSQAWVLLLHQGVVRPEVLGVLPDLEGMRMALLACR